METSDLSATHPEKLRNLRQKFYAWMTEMTDASGDDITDRLWTTTSAPVPGESTGELQSYQVADGTFTIEFDEKAGWVTNGTAIEVADSLTNGWQQLPPDSLEQLDRFLDLETYRASYSTGATQRFFRIKAQ